MTNSEMSAETEDEKISEADFIMSSHAIANAQLSVV